MVRRPSRPQRFTRQFQAIGGAKKRPSGLRRSKKLQVLVSKFIGLQVALLAVFFSGGEAAAYDGQTQEAERRHYQGRAYELYVPQALMLPAPAVLVLHGARGSGASIRRETNFDSWADRYGVVAIYPNGISGWNDGRNSRDVIKSEADDVSYLLGLITDLSNNGLIDPSAVYAIGMSNGGGMVMRLACEQGDRISGIGVVTKKELYGLDCEGHRPMPTAFFFGTKDPLLPHEGDPTGTNGLSRKSLGSTHSAEETISRWRIRNQCTNKATLSLIDLSKNDKISVERSEFQGCAAPLVYYEIEGGGHTWPGPTTRYRPLSALIRGKTARDIDASEETLRIWFGDPSD